MKCAHGYVENTSANIHSDIIMSDGLTKTYDALTRHRLMYYLAIPIFLLIWVLQGHPTVNYYDEDWRMKNRNQLKVTVSYSPSGEKTLKTNRR